MKLCVRAGLSGVAAAAVAVGVAEVVAVLTGPLSAPLLAVGGVVVDHVPGSVKDVGVRLFGVHDKTALIVGTAILLAAYAYGVGVVALRSWRVALGGIGLFAVVGVAAAMTRHNAGMFAWLPTIVGAGLTVWVLRHLLDLAGADLAGAGRAGAGRAGADLAGAGRAGAGRAGAGRAGAGRAGAGLAGGDHAGVGLAGADGVGADRVGTDRVGTDRVGTEGAGVAGAAGAGVAGAAGVGAAGAGVAGAAGVGAAGAGVAGAAGVGAAGAGVGLPVGVGVSGQGRPAGADGLGHDAGETEKPGTGHDAYSPESRRRFLRRLGMVAAVAAVSGVAGRLLTSRRAVTAARQQVVLPVPRQTAAPLPAGVQVSGAGPYVSSNQDFYRIDTALYPPQVDPTTWELRIHGMVRNPITLSWEQLLQRPMIERYVTLACVSNEVGGDLIGNALWLGTPIKELLDEADPLPGADQVIQRSVDGWTCGSPTAVLRDGRDALLTVGMNGRPLPVEHGFPVRMVVPGLYGYVSACKWITEIELSRFSDFDAYWVPRGWSQQAPIKTESRIDTPRDGAQRPAGTVPVAGVAWAQHRGISKVEVQVDDGPWVVATLAATVSSDTWRQWSYAWPATKGKHILRVRATDTAGQTQTSTPAPPAPDGATGWHSLQVRID